MNALRLNNFSFSYPEAEEKLFSALSLDLQEGAFALLTGATGSGKTTLLRSVKPELAPVGIRSGSVEVFGRASENLSLRDSSSLIGYVAQDPESQIICDLVWHEIAFGLENLGIPENEMRRRVAEVAYFFGIESLMHVETARLSGGQKQVVTLASIMVMQPRLLLLDEPTAQLDPIAEKNFLHALFRINRELGSTVFLATHSPEAALPYATEAYRLESGRLVALNLEEFNFTTDSFEPATLKRKELESKATQASPSELCAPVSNSVTPKPLGLNSPKPEALGLGLSKRKFPQPCFSSSKAAVILRDVYFRYTKTAPWVLRGMDLQVNEGSIHAVIGGNGSGKSTLLQSIAASLKPQRGSIKNVHRASQVLLPSYPKSLFVCDTLEEELREWQTRCGYTEEDIVCSLEDFGLVAHVRQHPYDLSGGQQQKLALAKLLLTKPKLMLLDEPTKALDPKSKCEIAEILIELRKKAVTIVLVTHDLAFVSQVADTVSMLFDGEATSTEATEGFFARNIFYRPKPDSFLYYLHEREARQG